MSLIAQLADILAESRAEYEEIMHGSGRNGGSGEAAGCCAGCPGA